MIVSESQGSSIGTISQVASMSWRNATQATREVKCINIFIMFQSFPLEVFIILRSYYRVASDTGNTEIFLTGKYILVHLDTGKYLFCVQLCSLIGV